MRDIRSIPKPDFPLREGIAAGEVARLVICGLLCVFQYWLLTATLEAYHAGDNQIPVGAFIASLACFLLAGGLILTGELALRQQRRYLRSTSARQEPSSSAPDGHCDD